ncbi:hypothetical protein QL285_089326 [Trifolium repens]|jgi:hypothetical protein|nr:hypothetical protein QL285_089326 [Trifolium repens]
MPTAFYNIIALVSSSLISVCSQVFFLIYPAQNDYCGIIYFLFLPDISKQVPGIRLTEKTTPVASVALRLVHLCGKHNQDSGGLYKPIRSDSFAIIGLYYVSFLI